MTVILNRPKKVSIGSMTTDTNTVIEIETKLMNELSILQDPNVGKERKKEARTNVRRYEKFMNDIDYKKINGHKYPVREVPPKTTKEEVLKLIESGFPEDKWKGRTVDLSDAEYYSYRGLDVTGVSVGKKRFEYVDKGWKEPKHMKPVNLFK